MTTASAQTIDLTCTLRLGVVPGIDQSRAEALELIQSAITDAVKEMKADYGIVLDSGLAGHDPFIEAADRLAGHPGPYVDVSKDPQITVRATDD